MPDPITLGSLVAWVLATAGEATIKGAVDEAAKNAYQALKEKIRPWAGGHIEALEKMPASTAEQAVLAKEIDQRPATEKEDIRTLATKLIEVLENQGRSGPIGLDLGTLKAVRVQLGEITVTEGIGARINEVGTPGDFTTGPITVGNLPKKKEVIDQYVHFTAYHPKEIKPEVWYTLITYVHILAMQSAVEADAKQRLEVPHGRRTAEATRGITRGAEIVVIPELPGCRFNPTSARLLWLEDWHRVEFRLQAQRNLAGFELEKAVNGQVAFHVESVLVGEVPIWACISDEADTTAADTPASTASAKPYEAIFVSYAHEDSAVVDRVGKVCKTLGMEFLRDVEALRSGEEWNPALLAMIERADIFQLYWSGAAKRSRYVKQEWRHALKQGKNHFIRPLYWQVPMPQPPRELAQLHFSYLQLDN